MSLSLFWVESLYQLVICVAKQLLLAMPQVIHQPVPGVEAKVVAELKGLGLAASPEAPTPRQLAFDDLAQLPYLAAVIKVQAIKLSGETRRRWEHMHSS